MINLRLSLIVVMLTGLTFGDGVHVTKSELKAIQGAEAKIQRTTKAQTGAMSKYQLNAQRLNWKNTQAISDYTKLIQTICGGHGGTTFNQNDGTCPATQPSK